MGNLGSLVFNRYIMKRDLSLFLNKTVDYLVFKDINSEKTKFICDCNYCGSKNNLVSVKDCFRISRIKVFHCSKCRPYSSLNDRHNWSGIGTMSGTYFNQIKLNAEYRNILFNISKEELWNLYLKQDRKCIITDEYIEFPNKSKSKINNNNGKASTDRIDNKKGYELNNIWIVHIDFNFYKWKYNMNEIIYYSNLVTNPLIQKNTNNFIIPNWWWNRFISQAKYNVNITKENIINLYEKQNGICYYTGLPMSVSTKVIDSKNHNLSIDRLDSNKDYNLDNIVLCDKNVNMMKGKLTVNRFKYIASKVTDKFTQSFHLNIF